MKNFLFASTLLVFCFVAACFAQNKPPKVIKYVAPKYSGTLVANRLIGEVIVTIKIDQEGKVISTKAENGHPLLQKISENAAKEWIFTKNVLSEQELKITFVYSIKTGKNKENVLKEAIYKIKFKKPYRLKITVIEYQMIMTDY